MKYELIDCRPVPAPVAGEVRAIKEAAGLAITSCERTQAAVDYARSRGCQLSSQAELYHGWITGQPGYNPANAPGYSTHERRSDGIAYGWVPRGAKLPYAWMVGIDNSDSAAFVREATRRGWLATVTYPASPSEGHHVNFRKRPLLKKLWVLLRRGSRGPRVRRLTGRLARLKLVHETTGTYLGHPRRRFGREVEVALERFQADHHLRADGVYGPHTAKQLRVAIRRQRRASR